MIAAIAYEFPRCVIIGVDKFDFKLDVALATGAQHALPLNSAVATRIQALTEQRGPDVYFECTVSSRP